MNSCCTSKRFGLSSSPVSGVKYKVNKSVLRHMKTISLARLCLMRAINTVTRNKVNDSVHLVSACPVWRLIISCCLGLMLLPEHSFKPQTMMSSAELKCSATGISRDRLRILRRGSLKRYRSRLPISPSLQTDWTLTLASRDCLCNAHYTHVGYSNGFICRSTPLFTLYSVHALSAFAYG